MQVKGSIKVLNNGAGIPVEVHKSEVRLWGARDLAWKRVCIRLLWLSLVTAPGLGCCPCCLALFPNSQGRFSRVYLLSSSALGL